MELKVAKIAAAVAETMHIDKVIQSDKVDNEGKGRNIAHWIVDVFENYCMSSLLEDQEYGKIGNGVLQCLEGDKLKNTNSWSKPSVLLSVGIVFADDVFVNKDDMKKKKKIISFVDNAIPWARVRSDDYEEEEEEEEKPVKKMTKEQLNKVLAGLDAESDSVRVDYVTDLMNDRIAKAHELGYKPNFFSFQYYAKLLGAGDLEDEKFHQLPIAAWVSNSADKASGKFDYFTNEEYSVGLEHRTAMVIAQIEAAIITNFGLRRTDFAIDHTILTVSKFTRRPFRIASCGIIKPH
jgi:hypothetical protein